MHTIKRGGGEEKNTCEKSNERSLQDLLKYKITSVRQLGKAKLFHLKGLKKKTTKNT